MQTDSLADWLSWQENLSSAEIELGLERVKRVAAKLQIEPPPGAVFVVAGTNGKGSCTAFIESVLRSAGRTTGLYTSPHLLRYNERVRINGVEAEDETLVAAFKRVESARGDVPLTFFEFGTLAAFEVFSARQCDAWVLEVGLGGRLDAVNIVAADFSLITTVDIDHREWLGDDRESIAAEKAGIFRPGKPAFYGDLPVPAAVTRAAREQAVQLHCLQRDFSYQLLRGEVWNWHGTNHELRALPLPQDPGEEQLRNLSVALAALESYEPGLFAGDVPFARLAAEHGLPGRFQRHHAEHEWIFDVAHNQQSARILAAKLARDTEFSAQPATFVIGMLADKQAEEFVAELNRPGDRWITCDTGGVRGSAATVLAERIADGLDGPVVAAGSVADALAHARSVTSSGQRIIVCGSFTVVGPALQQLGLYCAGAGG